MNNHRFHLDNTRPNKVFTCPSCYQKTLKRYVDGGNNQYLPQEVGRCNREVNCGYHITPKHYFADHSLIAERPPDTALTLPPKNPAPTFGDRFMRER